MQLRKMIFLFMMSPLLVLLASSMARAYSGYYYVIPSSFPLRECPRPECDTLLTVYQGDRVEIIERTETGWSRVRLVDRAAIGWIPNNYLSYSPDMRTSSVPTYYVNTSSLPLRDRPNPNAAILKMLHFHDPVEMLGVGTSGWAQVRDLESSVVGYVPPRYLSSAPPSQTKSPSRRRAPARKAAPKEKTAPAEKTAPPSAM